MSLHATIVDALGRMLGLEQTQAVDDFQTTLAAPWAHRAPVWLLFGCLGLALLAVTFYLRYQRGRHRGVRVTLAAFRAFVLCLLLLLLAEPILTINIVSRKRPLLWLVFDGTDSMAIQDDLPTADVAAIDEVLGRKKPDEKAPPPKSDAPRPSRMDYVKALAEQKGNNVLRQLGDKFRLQAFLFDGPQGVRSLDLGDGSSGPVDGKKLAEQLTTDGKVTAIGAALNDLGRRHATSNLGGVVLFSDFNQNSGPPAVEAARRLGVEVHTVGLGATTAADLAVELQAPVKVKKDERASIEVTLRQQGLDGQAAHVRLFAEPLGGLQGAVGSRVELADKTVPLTAAFQTIEFPYVPDRAGRFVLAAEADPLPGEIVQENNRAVREITVLEDFLRLLYVEYEPTWEWRFIKEVFYRDQLVGMKGFRTFLHSSDPRVRRVNELFVPSMTTARADFFAHDVIFLGDMPTSALTPRFCDMVKEFVGDFGGGLVVVAGPRFGPGQLAETSLADLLPVKVEAGTSLDDRKPFALKLTPMAGEFEFMQLGATPQETQEAWKNLGQLDWYQPVKRKHPQATILAEHPTATCVDGKEKQPLIAIRPYGRGEVIYLGFNETWRLRRLFGEKYYRQFWGQMIQRLALSHALGSQKRFVVRTDRRHYQTNEPVIVTVEAYNADFVAMEEKDLPEKRLRGEMLLPLDAASSPHGGEPTSVQPLSLSQLKKGVFETRLTVFTAGEHRVRVTDPISGNPVECTFQVTGTPVERQRAIRNAELQQALAVETGGKSYDFKQVRDLAEQIRPPARTEMSVEVISLAHTWLSFAIVVGLLLAEWFMRKWVTLP
jgi:hypothetical protein